MHCMFFYGAWLRLKAINGVIDSFNSFSVAYQPVQ